ncbi:MAG: hemolysin family protein [Flavobacteriales bacterium]
MDSSWLLIIIFSLAASAFSSGMEIAFITANKLKVELDRKQGVFAAEIIAHFLKHPKMYIATMLVGNNIGLVIFGLFMGEAISKWQAFNTFASFLDIGEYGMLLTQTLLSTVIVLVFAEFIPKAIFSINPNRWLNWFAVPVLIWYILLWIFAYIVTVISDLFLRVFVRTKISSEVVEFGRIDLDHYLSEATGNIDRTKELDHEIQIFQNALDFSKVKARDCLIPRKEIVGVEITSTVEELKQLFISTRLSKILVYRENIDHIIGYVHSFELFQKPEHIQHILRPVEIIPEPMAANEILERFIKGKKSMAVVVDEYGGTAGIITMEDIVEEIFGEIEDEHDKEETNEVVIDDLNFIFSARLEIEYLNDKYKLHLPVDREEYDTLGGLLLHLYEDIPKKGDVIDHENFTFEAIKVSDTRVEIVKISLNQ